MTGVMVNRPIQYKQNYRKSRGVISVLFAGVAAILVGILGVSTYIGMSAYIHGEMHEAANSAAGTAARALYDDIDENMKPLLNVEMAMSAGRGAYGQFIASNSFLNEQIGPNLTLEMTGPNQVTATVTGALNTPLLAVVGINNLTFEAESTAKYAQNEMGGICDLGADASEKASCVNTQAGPFSRVVALDLPLYDGGGMDLFINTGNSGAGYHGIMLEVCTNDITIGDTLVNEGACKPVKIGAIPYLEGAVIVRGDNHVLYGQVFIDLEGDGIEKGTAIKIIDDGVHDAYEINGPNDLGTRYLELVPQLTQPTSIRTLHHAILCRAESCETTNAGRMLTEADPQYS
jgi:hypothetical protein